jgi:hypothetical protein
MSKRTRYADNSKRRQPVQQQRLQAALQTSIVKKAAKLGDRQPQKERGAEQGNR